MGRLINAALGVAESGGGKLSDLAMDYASRMMRAKEQGFDVDSPQYHGTTADFDRFEIPKCASSVNLPWPKDSGTWIIYCFHPLGYPSW